jgi:hypothetical protein
MKRKRAKKITKDEDSVAASSKRADKVIIGFFIKKKY